jgi:hypothetical protein
MGKTCLNRLIGICENATNGQGCRIDYDTTHHPNNYDCPKYHEVTLLERTTVKVTLMEKVYMKIGELFGKDGKSSSRILEKRAKELERV